MTKDIRPEFKRWVKSMFKLCEKPIPRLIKVQQGDDNLIAAMIKSNGDFLVNTYERETSNKFHSKLMFKTKSKPDANDKFKKYVEEF